MKKQFAFLFSFFITLSFTIIAQEKQLDDYNITWTTQSKNSSESMPCGGGDIGLNVWVENGELLFYMARSGTFDEANALLKLGRVRMRFSPNPFEGQTFRQELILRDGSVKISANNGKLKSTITFWVDVFRPVVHVDVESNQPVTTEAVYENWRYKDKPFRGRAANATSYKWTAPADAKTLKDEISFTSNGVEFYHRNQPFTVFDISVKQQGLDSVKAQLYNPLKDLTFGGRLEGTNLQPAGQTKGVYLDTDYNGWKLRSVKAARLHNIKVYLHTAQATSVQQWKDSLKRMKILPAALKNQRLATVNWWKEFWNRSFIFIQPGQDNDSASAWQVGRNYQLMRYMLGCNAFGQFPTKFNGGLFTYDPSQTDTAYSFTPDFRNWGGGIHTAQNQRLVYFPMIKNGDFDLLKPQLDFYLRLLKNAELRSKIYWGHNGASFTEQLENFGLPNMAEYGTNRPPWFDKGVEYNAWLEYEWDTVLEFCLMMLEEERYTQKDIASYLPFIESCLRFFDEHYQYRAKQRGRQALDGNKHLVLYPGSGAETYKMAYNATSTIAALKTVTERMLQLPAQYLDTTKRKYFEGLLQRIPPITFAEYNGQKTIAPAKLWERVNNTETSQLYPIFPWGMYGIGKPDLDVAKNTYLLDTFALKFRSHVGWKQDNIWAARLGLVDEAKRLTVLKLQNSGRRFPAYFGPGYDWTPDHNWGGSGMIGLQEMLMQVDDRKIYLLPSWPKDWDVHFKLHAPYQTTVEAIVKEGKLEQLIVLPVEREKDIINLFEK
jgi:hypothetical protein